jgi:hypothetical protein
MTKTLSKIAKNSTIEVSKAAVAFWRGIAKYLVPLHIGITVFIANMMASTVVEIASLQGMNEAHPTGPDLEAAKTVADLFFTETSCLKIMFGATIFYVLRQGILWSQKRKVSNDVAEIVFGLELAGATVSAAMIKFIGFSIIGNFNKLFISEGFVIPPKPPHQNPPSLIMQFFYQHVLRFLYQHAVLVLLALLIVILVSVHAFILYAFRKAYRKGPSRSDIATTSTQKKLIHNDKSIDWSWIELANR